MKRQFIMKLYGKNLINKDEFMSLYFPRQYKPRPKPMQRANPYIWQQLKYA